ncbi:type III secretion protein HrpJ [Ralstonia sp. A12]|uniref:type III secretion protein HrpB2 n=1 Tax=Ralstonia sp. A12 TaxID=1217052 RepID=UPI000573F4D1|nr:type III secretion protein HrpB2 [Ralstonia sp. A12]KHK49850.1 type III secretion protein HrpJ [Ralstonia sp. A12]
MIQGPTAIAPVSASTPVTGTTPGEAVVPAPAPELVARFESLLQSAKHSQHHPKGPSAIGELVKKEDAAVQATMARVEAMTEAERGMSMQEVVAEGVRLQMECAATMTKIQLGSTIAHSGKNAVQTLMRNQ